MSSFAINAWPKFENNAYRLQGFWWRDEYLLPGLPSLINDQRSSTIRMKLGYFGGIAVQSDRTYRCFENMDGSA